MQASLPLLFPGVAMHASVDLSQRTSFMTVVVVVVVVGGSLLRERALPRCQSNPQVEVYILQLSQLQLPGHTLPALGPAWAGALPL